MKKTKLLLLLFTCGLLAACGKKDKTDVGSQDANYAGAAKERPSYAYEEDAEADAEMVAIPGVLIPEGQTDYIWSYGEQADGNILFAIEGNWTENDKWDVEPSEDPVASIKEVSRTNQKIEYQFTGEKDIAGYSEYTISLSDSDKTKFVVVFSLLASQDGTLTALDAVDYIPSEETDDVENVVPVRETTAAEETEEYISPDEAEYIAEQEKQYDALMAERTYPEAFTIIGKGTTDILETTAATVSFDYKEYSLYCSIVPQLTIDDIKQAVDTSDTWKTKTVGETEVVYYMDGSDTTMMWMDEVNVCYMLSGREVPEAVYFEAIKLMLGK